MAFIPRELIRVLKVSPRQLQWWDEQGVIQPTSKVKHCRIYSRLEAIQIAALVELRRRDVSLLRCRQAVKALAKHPERDIDHVFEYGHSLFIVVDLGRANELEDTSAAVSHDATTALKQATKARGAVVVVQVGPKLRQLLAEPATARKSRRVRMS